MLIWLRKTSISFEAGSRKARFGVSAHVCSRHHRRSGGRAERGQPQDCGRAHRLLRLRMAELARAECPFRGVVEIDGSYFGPTRTRGHKGPGSPEMQTLEDVICFVFLRWYFADFTLKHAD